MYVEIPEFKRCCMCVPLRYGLLIFGYLSLLFSIFWFFVEAVQCYFTGMDLRDYTITLHKGVSYLVETWVALVLHATDIAFYTVLIVGAHKKNTRLMRVFFYYSVTTLAASFLLFLITRGNVHESLLYIHIAEMFFAVFCFGLQIFILLLVRSEIKKLKENTGHRFVNHAAEVCVDIPTGNGHNPF
ncbi:uncharacterized protein LOC121734864 isoform X1 [Aricia agestis]|uniref:uncharacterized protein LOC121734864 isoform X1 n=1 Tax=Aricia agestis TaxID=91739 RepID=UPI001C20236F|nr:uncharacterized protein LOC121734864 isoform X1 [Aricia agestis]